MGIFLGNSSRTVSQLNMLSSLCTFPWPFFHPQLWCLYRLRAYFKVLDPSVIGCKLQVFRCSTWTLSSQFNRILFHSRASYHRIHQFELSRYVNRLIEVKFAPLTKATSPHPHTWIVLANDVQTDPGPLYCLQPPWIRL